MKLNSKGLSFIILLFLIPISNSWGQKSNYIKTNIVSPVLGIYGLTYEKGFHKKVSGEITISKFKKTMGTSDYNGWHLLLSAKFFRDREKAREGFYFGPQIRLMKFVWIQNDSRNSRGYDQLNYKSAGAGMNFGWQWYLGEKDGFVIDYSVGGVINGGHQVQDEENSGEMIMDLQIIPRTGISFGFNF